MSILLDDREDSSIQRHLAQFGLPISVVRLDAGDLAIQSSGGLLIGYERKHLDDLLQCMQDRRLSGFQIREMWKLYDRVELVIESLWRPGEDGAIEVPSRSGWQTLFFHGSGISYRQLDSYLYSQYECGGVPCWRTGSTIETAHLYASRYYWWQKDYELHKSHDVLFTNYPSAQRRGAVTLHHGDPNSVTLFAAQIPGLDAKAWSVGEHPGFRNAEGHPSPELMAQADVREWMTVEWTDRKGQVRHFSAQTAAKIVDWLRGNHK